MIIGQNNMNDINTSWKIKQVTSSLNNLLQEKNIRYGDAALSPIKIFSKVDADDSICVRLDDKISRIKNSDTLRKNDVADIMGYLVLLCASKEWISFNDLID